MNAEIPLTEAEKRIRVTFVATAFVLLSIIIIALVYLATSRTTAATSALSFAGGVSNIFLPCTLPLAFIIVPLSMSEGYRKGLAMAILFGLGLTITLAVYGVALALIGRYLGLDQATRIMYLAAGLASLLFGLSELKLVKFEMPAYARTPRFVEERSDYLKVFFLGLFLGNAGVGCPNPVTYVLLVYVASTGSLWDGFWLMGMNGIGRALPLVFLATIGIIGVNALPWLLRRKVAVDKFVGWSLVVLASFIILNGIFGHLWYEGGIFHEGLNMVAERVGGQRLAEADIPIGEIEQKVPFVQWGAWANLALTLGVLAWFWWRNGRHLTREVMTVLIVFVIWGATLFPVGIKAM
ncbi:MAG: cytochrome c biogenesis CcdA family protein [Pseudomonadota bacterium]